MGLRPHGGLIIAKFGLSATTLQCDSSMQRVTGGRVVTNYRRTEVSRIHFTSLKRLQTRFDSIKFAGQTNFMRSLSRLHQPKVNHGAATFHIPPTTLISPIRPAGRSGAAVKLPADRHARYIACRRSWFGPGEYIPCAPISSVFLPA